MSARGGASRIFVTSTRSLARLDDGPLQKLVAALGPMHAGTYTEISAHSPREDVIAGAQALLRDPRRGGRASVLNEVPRDAQPRFAHVVAA